MKAWQDVSANVDILHPDKTEEWRYGYRRGCRAWYCNDLSDPVPVLGDEGEGFRQGTFDCDISCDPQHRLAQRRNE